MHDSDLQELQKDTFNIVIVLTAIYGLVLLYIVLIKAFVLAQNIPYWWLSPTLIFATCIHCYNLTKSGHFRRGTYRFIGGLVITVISFMLSYEYERFHQREAYLLVLVVAMAGLLINPRAAIYTAIFAITLTVSAAFVLNGANVYSLVSLAALFAPLTLTGAMAMVSSVSSEHLTTTLKWAMDSQARAQHRARELFEKQLELQKAYQMVETANIRLKQAEAAAVQASQFKTRFITNLSHELRTPLSAIINFSYILSKKRYGDVTPEQQDYLKRIHEAGDLLLNIVNDLLDLAKIESGQMEIFREPVDLAALGRGVMDTISGLVSDEVELRQEISPNLPRVSGDQTRIQQILLNLLGNAIKYTNRGYITLRMVRQEPDNGRGFVQVSVIDTGIGIKVEDFERIFEEFQQTQEAFAMRKVGTGLGLPISKKFVELHGGQLWLESEYGRGSTFHFTLPVAVEEVLPEPSTQPEIIQDKVMSL
jgi:signal transduction histidine kinase